MYAQARARTPARHALAILYAAVAALRAPRKLIVKQAFNTPSVQTGHWGDFRGCNPLTT